MPKETSPELIESTAGDVAAELARRGIRADQRVTVTIEPAEPDDWISKGRAYARPKVIAEGPVANFSGPVWELREKAVWPNFWSWIGASDACVSTVSCVYIGSAERNSATNRARKNFATGPSVILPRMLRDGSEFRWSAKKVHAA